MSLTQPLWSAPESRRRGSRIQSFLDRNGFNGYDEAWEWSVSPEHAGDFWGLVADQLGVKLRRRPDALLEADTSRAPGARWFRGAELNYAENALSVSPDRSEEPAVIALSQTRPEMTLSWSELSSLVARVRAGFVEAGVRRGDRVAGCLPNVPETLAAMLAAASLGAVWTSCAPETGPAGVLDRFSQVDPKVLLVVDGYRYGPKEIDRTEQSAAILAGLPTVTKAVWLPYLRPEVPPPPGWTGWEELVAHDGPLEFEALDFEHPLYVLFSSGTTGKPKAIVHGHGGIVLEHTKALALHFDLGPEDRFFWFTTTGWMMWNFCVSGLLVGAAVVLFDGDPGWPGVDTLWEVMSSTSTTCGGVGSGYLVACQKAGSEPSRKYDLSALKTLGATGSPLPPSAASWVYEKALPDVMLSSFSGGTDVCTGFVGSSPLHPVWAGEISCRCLGAAVEIFDDDGKPVVGSEGELVLSGPLPSMPVGFWNDPAGSRYRSAYFERFPGVWAHGDRATLTDRGTVVITGRSDGTLNRGGVRIGTAELYAVVESFAEVADSLVVHLDDASGGPGEIWLFVVEAPGASLAGSDLADRLRAALRKELSPRHVPDQIVAIPAVPRTLSGKKLEVPVKRILAGADPAEVLTLASLANPESLETIVGMSRSRTSSSA